MGKPIAERAHKLSIERGRGAHAESSHVCRHPARRARRMGALERLKRGYQDERTAREIATLEARIAGVR